MNDYLKFNKLNIVSVITGVCGGGLGIIWDVCLQRYDSYLEKKNGIFYIASPNLAEPRG